MRFKYIKTVFCRRMCEICSNLRIILTNSLKTDRKLIAVHLLCQNIRFVLVIVLCNIIIIGNHNLLPYSAVHALAVPAKVNFVIGKRLMIMIMKVLCCMEHYKPGFADLKQIMLAVPRREQVRCGVKSKVELKLK